MKTATRIFNVENLEWHLRSNVFERLTDKTIAKIIEQCRKVNAGKLSLNDEIAPGSNVTIAEMLEDLKIDYNL